MNRAYFIIISSIVVATMGQICIKLAMLRLGPLVAGSPAMLVQSTVRIMSQPLIWAALPLYGAGFVLWAIALSRVPLSIAHPMLAMSYIITRVAAVAMFGEHLTPASWVGFALLMAGVLIIGHR